MSKTLAELSSAASQGEWAPGHLGDETTLCNCRSVVTDQILGCVFKATSPADVEERFRSEYPTDDESAANMRFVCELVNRFRAGQLVERDLIIEECAKIADKKEQAYREVGIAARGIEFYEAADRSFCLADSSMEIASAIRALKTPVPNEGPESGS